MRYRLIKDGDEDMDIFTEDGGVASLHFNGDHYITTYYQRTIDIEEYHLSGYDIWTYLLEDDTYMKDWDTKPTDKEFIEDAVEWLVCPYPQQLTEDNSLFKDIL